MVFNLRQQRTCQKAVLWEENVGNIVYCLTETNSLVFLKFHIY